MASQTKYFLRYASEPFPALPTGKPEQRLTARLSPPTMSDPCEIVNSVVKFQVSGVPTPAPMAHEEMAVSAEGVQPCLLPATVHVYYHLF